MDQALTEGLEWLEISTAIFYALVWAFSFLTAFWRTSLPDLYKSISVSISHSAFSGFIGLAVVSFLVGKSDSGISGHWYYICFVSPTVGALVNFQVLLLDLLGTTLAAILPDTVKDFFAHAQKNKKD